MIDQPAITADGDVDPRRAKLDAVGLALEKYKKEAMDWRAHYDQRFIDAENQFNEAMVPLKDAREKQGPTPRERDIHQSAPDNITRSTTIVISSRKQDMLFPTRALNFDIEAVQDAKAAMQANPQPGMAQGQATAMEGMDEAADKMEKLCASDLETCQYAKVARKAIFDGDKYGTGVLFGPFPKRRREIYTTVNAGMIGMAVREDDYAGFESWDPWDFYPQPARCIEESEYAFKLEMLTRTQVKSLAKQPGFDAAQIKRLLKEFPNPELGELGKRPLFVRGNGSGGDAEATMKGRYPVWRYIGPIDRECLGYMMSDAETGKPPVSEDGDPLSVEAHYGLDELDDDDLHHNYISEVWVSHGIVIKAVPFPTFEEADRLPLYVTQYEKDPAAIFGFSVGHAIRFDQAGANIALSAAFLNAMMSAGVTGGYLKGALESENGDQQLSFIRPQMFAVNPKVVPEGDIRKALTFTTVPVTIDASLALYERIKENADQHSLMPVLGPGDAKRNVTAASGIAMLLNNDNIVQRSAANAWDDDVTMPAISALVRFQNQTGRAAAHGAIGEFAVKPRATGHLLVKDQRLQHNMVLLQMAQSDPDAAILIRKDELIRQIVSDADGDNSTMLRDDKEVEALRQQQGQQPSPEQMEQETKLEIAKIEQQTKLHEVSAGIQREEIQSRANMQIAAMQMRTAAMKLASDEKVAMATVIKEMRLEEIDRENTKIITHMSETARERIAALKIEADKYKTGAQMELEAQKIADQKESRAVQLRVEKPVRIAQ